MFPFFGRPRNLSSLPPQKTQNVHEDSYFWRPRGFLGSLHVDISRFRPHPPPQEIWIPSKSPAFSLPGEDWVFRYIAQVNDTCDYRSSSSSIPEHRPFPSSRTAITIAPPKRTRGGPRLGHVPGSVDPGATRRDPESPRISIPDTLFGNPPREIDQSPGILTINRRPRKPEKPQPKPIPTEATTVFGTRSRPCFSWDPTYLCASGIRSVTKS